MITCEGVPVIVDERVPYGVIEYRERTLRLFWERPIVLRVVPVLVAAATSYGAALAYNLAEAYQPAGVP